MIFRVPPFWSERDFEQELDEVEEPMKWLSLAQGRAAYLVEFLEGTEVSPAKLGWLIIWSRVQQALEDVHNLLASHSSLATSLLERAIGETEMDLRLIAEPGLCDDHMEPLALMEIEQRLGAYVAWCVWNDVQLYERMLRRRNLQDAWDPEPALSSLASDFFRNAFPNLENVETNRARLNKGRRDQEDRLLVEVEASKELILDLGLSDWWEELEGARKKEAWCYSFAELIRRGKTSVSKEMKKWDMAFAYSDYMRLANRAHGSSLRGLVYMKQREIMPNVHSGTPNASEQTIGAALNILFVLGAIAHFMGWED